MHRILLNVELSNSKVIKLSWKTVTNVKTVTNMKIISVKCRKKKKKKKTNTQKKQQQQTNKKKKKKNIKVKSNVKSCYKYEIVLLWLHVPFVTSNLNALSTQRSAVHLYQYMVYAYYALPWRFPASCK